MTLKLIAYSHPLQLLFPAPQVLARARQMEIGVAELLLLEKEIARQPQDFLVIIPSTSAGIVMFPPLLQAKRQLHLVLEAVEEVAVEEAGEVEGEGLQF